MPKYFFFIVSSNGRHRFDTDEREEVMKEIEKDKSVKKFLMIPDAEWFDCPDFWFVREGDEWFVSHNEDDGLAYTTRSSASHPMEFLSILHPTEIISRFSWGEGECPDED